MRVHEQNFHLMMGGVFLTTVIVEQFAQRLLPSWNPPDVGILTLVAATVWVARYAAWRNELSEEQHRVLISRVERLERTNEELEQILLARQAPIRRDRDG